MAKEFEIRRVNELPATPEQVWDAVATGPGNRGWRFPIEIEPREGGVVSRGPSTVTVWDPPRRFAFHHEGKDGFSASLRYRIEAHDNDATILHTVIHWVDHGVVDAAWKTKTDAADKYTEFRYHTLGVYLRYFSGRPATCLEILGPESSAEAHSITVLRRELGVTDNLAQGDTVRLALAELEPLGAVVDYLSPHFIGLRTADGLYRFYIGSAWGWPISVSLHLFADDVDQDKTERAWRTWLAGVFA